MLVPIGRPISNLLSLKINNMKLVKEKKITAVSFDSWSDWKWLFFLFIVLTCIGLVWSGYLYWGVESGDAFFSDATATSTNSILPLKDMKVVEDRYDSKARAFGVYSVTASSTVIDPSL